jgi:uncharacterized protein DUF6527
MTPILRAHEISENLISIFCPACGYDHSVGVNGRFVHGSDGKLNTWTWNGSLIKPTFSPSLLVNKHEDGGYPRCHSFVTDGYIRYLDDCTHGMKGKTVELPEWGPLNYASLQ